MKYINVELLKESLLGWLEPLKDNEIEHLIDTCDKEEINYGNWIVVSSYPELNQYVYKCPICGRYQSYKSRYCEDCGMRAKD